MTHPHQYVHGVNITAHLEILLATERGRQGNILGYNGMPKVRVIRRKQRLNTYGIAYGGRYGQRKFDHMHSIVINEVPGFDGFDAIETVCHELAHLLAPPKSRHGHGWKMCYTKLALQAYGVQIPYHDFNPYHGLLAPRLRNIAGLGLLGVK